MTDINKFREEYATELQDLLKKAYWIVHNSFPTSELLPDQVMEIFYLLDVAVKREKDRLEKEDKKMFENLIGPENLPKWKESEE